MRVPATLTTKLLSMGAGFLLVALMSIGLTLWVTWRLEGGAAAVNEAGRLRMNMMRMVLARQLEATEDVRLLADKFDASLELLRHGDPRRPLFVPWDDEIRQRFERVRQHWQLLRQQWDQEPPSSGTAAVANADAFVNLADNFVASIETEMAHWTRALRLFQLGMMVIVILAAIGFIAVSYMLVISPVGKLQQALARMRQGDLGTRLQVQTHDEFGQLCAGFNLMAHALQSSHHELERKVQEKTANIEVQNRRLKALYDVSALAGEASTLELLAQGFVRQIRLVANADAAAVRWSDETNERYVLLVGDALPKAMATGEHCLHTGTCACGQPKASAYLRVIPITAQSTLPLPHCRDAGFQTMVSVPVQVHQRLLGEVNLFFYQSLNMSAEMRELLAAMARHLAGAMEGLRATALEREAAVAQERAMIARELHDSIAQSLAFLKIQTQLLRDAVARGNTVARDCTMAELDLGVRECYADVRELLLHFRIRTSEEDIEIALQTTLSKFGYQTGIAHSLSMDKHGLPLASDVQIQVLHIVQEALSNVRKHSKAKCVKVQVSRHPYWRFEVADDGIGFDPGQLSSDSVHVGLGIMRERAERINAVVHIDSAPGAGTRIILDLPTAAAVASPTPNSQTLFETAS